MHNKLKFLIPFVALILMTCGGTPVYASALFYGAGSAGTRPHIPKPAALAKFEAGGVTGAALEYVGHVWESTNVAAGFKFQPYWYQQGTASTNMTAVASSLGAINVKTAPYNCKGNGVTDDTAGIQKALNDSIVNHKTVLAPDGTYVITSTLTYVLPGGSTFNAGPKIVGNGSTSSIFLNHVVGGPMIKFDVNASNGAYNVIHGAKIQGIQIRGSGNSYANSDGIYMRRTYFADLNDVYISDLSGNGIVFYNGDTVSGDNDACYNVAISNSHIDKCKKWGVTFQNPTGGIAYNQTSNFDMRNLWVSQCGIKMGANADGSGSGSIQFNDSVYGNIVNPTSGGMDLKGQQISGMNVSVSECTNVGIYVRNDGYGQAKRLFLQNYDSENNIYGLWVAGCQHVSIGYYRDHHSQLYAGKGSVVIDARSALCDFVTISNVDLLADSTLGPNFIAFDAAGTQNFIHPSINNVFWTVARTGGQQTYGPALTTSKARPALVSDNRADLENFGRQWNSNTLVTFEETATGPPSTPYTYNSWNINMDKVGTSLYVLRDFSNVASAVYHINLGPPTNRSSTDHIKVVLEIWNDYNTLHGHSVTIDILNTSGYWIFPSGSAPTFDYKTITRCEFEWISSAQVMIPTTPWQVTTLP